MNQVRGVFPVSLLGYQRNMRAPALNRTHRAQIHSTCALVYALEQTVTRPHTHIRGHLEDSRSVDHTPCSGFRRLHNDLPLMSCNIQLISDLGPPFPDILDSLSRPTIVINFTHAMSKESYSKIKLPIIFVCSVTLPDWQPGFC